MQPEHDTRAWPVQLALGAVVTLFVGMVGVDLVIARRVADRTAEIVENTQRSVELLEDLHSETFQLARSQLSASAVDAVADRLRSLALKYDRVADDIGERHEWDALRALTEQMIAGARAGHLQDLRARSEEVDQRIDRLIGINRRAAHVHADEIRAAHRQAILADGTVGAVVLGLCVAVALVLRRLLARQRTLFAAHIALLDERNRELDLFAGRAAHDLRSPLSPIRGYADLLSTGAETPAEVQQMASRIRTAVDKMARVVDDMLELSRAGRPQPGRASARAVALEVLEELEAELRGATVTAEISDETVACAPGVLQQIVRNLVQNAVKFRARDRALELRIEGTARGAVFAFEVRDNGVGMDTELAAHAFEPHYRGRTDREVPGHGLGLAIVHRTTLALGGTIELHSEPDRGCRVLLTLPIAPPI